MGRKTIFSCDDICFVCVSVEEAGLVVEVSFILLNDAHCFIVSFQSDNCNSRDKIIQPILK